MASNNSGSKKTYVVEFPELPGVLFTVTEQTNSSRRDGMLLAELLHKVAAEIWFWRSAEDRQRVMDEISRMEELSNATLAYVLKMMERADARQSDGLPTIAVSGSEETK
jgi:hypothetical protein